MNNFNIKKKDDRPNCFTVQPDGRLVDHLTIESIETTNPAPNRFKLYNHYRTDSRPWGPVFHRNKIVIDAYVSTNIRRMKRYDIQGNSLLLLILTGIPIEVASPLIEPNRAPLLFDQLFNEKTGDVLAELWLLTPLSGLIKHGKLFFNNPDHPSMLATEEVSECL